MSENGTTMAVGEAETQGKLLAELKVQELRNELEKRQLDKNGIKIILSVRLEKAIRDEGHDPNTYLFHPDAPAAQAPIVESQTQSQTDKTDAKTISLVEQEKENGARRESVGSSEQPPTATANAMPQPPTITTIIAEPGSVENSAGDVPAAESQVAQAVMTPVAVPEVLNQPQIQTQLQSTPVEFPVTNEKPPTHQPSQTPIQQVVVTNEPSTRPKEEPVKTQETEEKAKEVATEKMNTTTDEKSSVAASTTTTTTSASIFQAAQSADSKPVNEDVEMLEDPLVEAEEEKRKEEEAAKVAAKETQKSPSTGEEKPQQMSQEETNKRSVWIRGISKDTTAASLKTLCSKIGKVIRAKIFTTRDARATCFGFVTMADEATAQKCVQELHNSVMPGTDNKIIVEKADAKSKKITAPSSGTGASSSNAPSSSADSANKASSSSDKPAQPKHPGSLMTREEKQAARRERRRQAREAAASSGGYPGSRRRPAPGGYRGSSPSAKRSRGGGANDERGGRRRNPPPAHRGPPPRFASAHEPRGGTFPRKGAGARGAPPPSRYNGPSPRSARDTSTYRREAGAGGAGSHRDPRHPISISTQQLRRGAHPTGRGDHHASPWDRRSAHNDQMEAAMRRQEEERATRDREIELMRLQKEAEAIRLEREKIEKEKMELQLQTALAQQQLAAAHAASGGVMLQAQQQAMHGGRSVEQRRSHNEGAERNRSSRSGGSRAQSSRSHDRTDSRERSRHAPPQGSHHGTRAETQQQRSRSREGRTGTLVDFAREQKRSSGFDLQAARNSVDSRVIRPLMSNERSGRLADHRDERRERRDSRLDSSYASSGGRSYVGSASASALPSAYATHERAYNPNREVSSLYGSSTSSGSGAATSYYAQSRDAFGRVESYASGAGNVPVGSRSSLPSNWTGASSLASAAGLSSLGGYGPSGNAWNTAGGSSSSALSSNINTSTTGWNRTAVGDWAYSGSGGSGGGASSSGRYSGSSYDDKYGGSRRY